MYSHSSNRSSEVVARMNGVERYSGSSM
jgi:hypothetical protein